MTKSVLFLDDDEKRCKKFRSACPSADIVNTAAQCIDRLRANQYDIVFLDHDLGGEIFVDRSRDDTGSGVVRWVCEHKPKVAEFVCHSLNPNGRQGMAWDLAKADYIVRDIPFTVLTDELIGHLTQDEQKQDNIG